MHSNSIDSECRKSPPYQSVLKYETGNFMKEKLKKTHGGRLIGI
jgi:hypothetical protein